MPRRERPVTLSEREESLVATASSADTRHVEAAYSVAPAREILPPAQDDVGLAHEDHEPL